MTRNRKRTHLVAGELNLTAMIDVAFQMLNFFVITMSPMAIVANVDVSRPSQRNDHSPAQINFFRITILPDGKLTINDRPVSQDYFERSLGQLAALDTTVTVLVACTPQSPHGKLVEVLDLCAATSLTNLSLLSVN